tara:strand:+ start:35 stop:1822 length:1788 start_codon:yes stop_codon:yes gene_type:complete
MAALSFSEIIKVFYSGPLVGKKRYTMITKKVKDKTPFILTTGDTKILEFVSDTVRTKFSTGNLSELASVAGRKAGTTGSHTPLKDEDGNLYRINQLEKTEEFGGKTGGGRPGGGADPHELMTAALIVKYGQKGSPKIPASDYNTIVQAEKNLNILKSVAATVDGKRQKDIDAMDGDFSNYAKAISAANGFLGAMNTSSRVKKVYLTGKQWSKEVSKYRVTTHEYFGKKDYNSSDIVVDLNAKRGGKPFRILVGISLKKKAKENDKDPTIINKTVTGEKGLFAAIIKRNDLTKMRQDLLDLYEARAQFFYNVVEATLYSPLTTIGKRERDRAVKNLSIGDGKKEAETLYKREISKLLGSMKTNPKLLSQILQKSYEEKERVVQQNIKTYLKNLKMNVSTNELLSKKVTKAADLIGQDKAKDALIGKYPAHVRVDNIYFKKFFSMMTDSRNTQYIAKGLMNIIFKLDMSSLMEQRKQYNEEFRFTLITGAGELINDIEVTPYPPNVMPEESTTAKITEMVSEPGAVYVIRGETGYKQPFEGGTSKSLKFELLLGGYEIVNMEIRYKGSVTPEPQFQAIITPTFKRLVKERKAPDVRY